jgi:L-serine dehydratase
MPDYTSVIQLAAEASRQKTTIGKLVLIDQAEQMEMSPEQLMHIIDQRLTVMEKSAESGLNPDLRSTSGLTGGDGWRMHQYEEKALGGAFCSRAMTTALCVAEYNAAMGRIVASPTAGSCGILPGAVLTMMSLRGISREEACYGLLCAGGIGLVIANQATIAGAEGGCQAECGAAAAMAAAALVELSGGTPDMCAHAVAMALKNQMGLVCDPVAGLVEVPCVKRNVVGAVNAITCADMALAGVESRIPVDQVIDCMGDVGRRMPVEFRETALGGLAATPFGQSVKDKMLRGEF